MIRFHRRPLPVAGSAGARTSTCVRPTQSLSQPSQHRKAARACPYYHPTLPEPDLTRWVPFYMCYFHAHNRPPFMRINQSFLTVTSMPRRTTRTSAVLRHRHQVQTRSLFISLSFAPYHRAPFTPSFADGGVQRSLALYLLAFPPAFPPCVVESHLSPTPRHHCHSFTALAHDDHSFGSSPVRRPPFD